VPYVIQEGSLNINYSIDQTINILTFNRTNAAPIQFIITRDPGESGESLVDSVNRQIKTLKRQVKDFSEINRQETTVGTSQWTAINIETRFKQAGQSIYQSQIITQLPNTTLLIFTLSCITPLDDTIRKGWIDTVKNFIPTT
jgi:hypothetical protein